LKIVFFNPITSIDNDNYSVEKQLVIYLVIEFFLQNSNHPSVPVPVLSTLELSESVPRNVPTHLVGVRNILASYLSTQMHNKSDLGFLVSQQVSNFELKNYVDLFYLDGNSELCLRAQNHQHLDREVRDTYELFISSTNADSLKSLVPARFRVLVKLADVNDNRPQFYEPYEARLSSFSAHDSPGYNRTVTWSQLTQSSKKQPLWSVSASDLDAGVNGLVEYELAGDKSAMLELTNLLIEVDRVSGSVCVNAALARNTTLLEFLWRAYATLVRLEFGIVAKDMGRPQLSRAMAVNLDVLFVQSSHLVHFSQTFYHFRVAESFESALPIGYVNSVVKHNGLGLDAESGERIVYSISHGDVYNQFRVDYGSGALSVGAALDHKVAATYLLTVSAYNVAKPDHVTNATVRIDVDVNELQMILFFMFQ